MRTAQLSVFRFAFDSGFMIHVFSVIVPSLALSYPTLIYIFF